jgi:hypothetical protein
VGRVGCGEGAEARPGRGGDAREGCFADTPPKASAERDSGSSGLGGVKRAAGLARWSARGLGLGVGTGLVSVERAGVRTDDQAVVEGLTAGLAGVRMFSRSRSFGLVSIFGLGLGLGLGLVRAFLFASTGRRSLRAGGESGLESGLASGLEIGRGLGLEPGAGCGGGRAAS